MNSTQSSLRDAGYRVGRSCLPNLLQVRLKTSKPTKKLIKEIVCAIMLSIQSLIQVPNQLQSICSLSRFAKRVH